MSGYGDPYRQPRDQGRGDRYDDRGARGGRGEHGGGYGGRHERDYRYERGGSGHGGGGRGRSDWDAGGRDAKRGRYEDYGAGRGDSSFSSCGYPSQPQPYAGQPAQPAYGHPAHAPAHTYGSAGYQESAPPARKPVKPEAPSASVILLNLPEHVNDTLLRYFLEDMGASIDSTTVIMDRQMNISKRFGFAKFSSVEHARAFIEPNFPSIPWRERGGPGPADGTRIKINYSQKSGGWREDQGATARLTDDQRAAEGSANQSFYVNDGTRDVGSTPSQILLLRGLDPLTNEDEIFTALSRVGGQATQDIARGGLKKIYIAKDRQSRSSWGFAFVRFTDTRVAAAVLAAVFNPQFHPTGFRVRNSVAAASFSHENSFIPIYSDTPWAFTGENGNSLAYWDDKGFVQPWSPPVVDYAEAMKNVPKAPRAQEAAKMDADMAAFLDSLGPEDPFAPDAAAPPPAATAAPAIAGPPAPVSAPAASLPSAHPTTASPAPATSAPSSSIPTSGFAPISIKPINTLPGASVAAAPPAKPPTPAAAVPPPTAAAPLGAKEKKSDLIVSRKAAGSIAKWNTKAKELRTAPAPAAPDSTSPAEAASQPQPSQAANASSTVTQPASSTTASATVAPDDPEFEHGDPTNLANPEVVAASATRKAASLKKHAAASPAATATTVGDMRPKYVDRAAARREALGQSDHPEAKKGGKKKFDGPEASAVTKEPVKNQLEEENNAGRKMLEKMGWSAGAGLGASGDGRVDPVQAAQFKQGAGLGATKGVAVGTPEEEKTHGQKMREKALERFNAS
ncbi:hypothetical protein JCM8547_002774 [Rhodosporidiobolus lusitaniae]